MTMDYSQGFIYWGGWGEGSTPNSTSSPPQKFLNKKLLKVHKGVNYACTHNFKYSISIKIIEFISLAAVGYTVVVHVMDRLDNINTFTCT